MQAMYYRMTRKRCEKNPEKIQFKYFIIGQKKRKKVQEQFPWKISLKAEKERKPKSLKKRWVPKAQVTEETLIREFNNLKNK